MALISISLFSRAFCFFGFIFFLHDLVLDHKI
uniref:Uncharacterized protein n=1 Tax=Rhizophora mucronata TaxID=61149 RepID=A0A2P2PYW1_RHIMU